MNEVPLFNSSVFREFCAELGNEDAVEVLLAFLADAPGKMMAMATADRSSIKRAAHSIKSSAATFGFENLSALARSLEAGIDGMSDQQVQDSVKTLRQAVGKAADFARMNLLQPAY